ncbi:MAG: hypothetical protein IPH20_16505 [Bacteroidales bacterium]|nr:hypothetical protein [Bacteroidales bacterium]
MQTAAAVRQFIEPRIAMLSYSNFGSVEGKHSDSGAHGCGKSAS